MTPLDLFNTQPAPEATAQLLACCHSHAWAEALVSHRPYKTPEALTEEADRIWFRLNQPAWLEAFAAHPRIGEKKAAETAYLAASQTEQSAAQDTLAPVAEALLLGNRAYEEKFGFRYIIFASNRTAPELLAVLEARLNNSRDSELHEAARQQMHITHLRMTKWLNHE